MNLQIAQWQDKNRLQGLRRFAIAITVLNLLGHLWFGFEQSFAQPLVAVAAAYAMELGLEALDAWSSRRRPHFTGGTGKLIDSFYFRRTSPGLPVRCSSTRTAGFFRWSSRPPQALLLRRCSGWIQERDPDIFSTLPTSVSP